MVWKFRTNPDKGRGVVCQKPDVRKNPKNKYRNYSIMSNFTTVFACTLLIILKLVEGTVLQCVITVVLTTDVCYLSILIIAGTPILFI